MTSTTPQNAEPAAVEFEVRGMHCAACVGRVERAIAGVAGVQDASVNLVDGRAWVSVDPDRFDPELVAAEVERAGYEAVPATRDEPGVRSADPAGGDPVLARRLLVGVALTIPVLLIGHGSLLIPALRSLDETTRTALDWAAGLLTIPIIAWVGAGFFRRAWAAFRTRQATMDTLVALGTGAAFVYSWAVLLVPESFPEGTGRPFFEATAVVITLVLVGNWMEARARSRTSSAIRALLELAPERALVLRDGRELEVPVGDVRIGDRVVVRPGGRVPVDGTVVAGESAVDEALLTGESVPVPKTAGDPVTGGTVNTAGRLEVRAERVGEETALARVVALVRRAQGSKPPIQRLVDRVAHVFVPAVMLVAVAAFTVWYLVGPEPRLNYAVIVAAAVLLISCPCALGLATPISVMIGIGKAAENGVLIRSGEALERARRVDVVVFDKTGTLTRGRPEVTDVVSLDGGREAEEVAALAAAVEAGSEHPLGRAIVSHALGAPLGVPAAEGFRARPGHGVEAVVGGRSIRVGTPRYMAEAGVDLQPAEEELEAMGRRGRSPVLVSEDARLIGLIGLADQARPEAKEVVAALRKSGTDVVMLTGDHPSAAHAVAAEVGISTVRARVLPDDKARVIEELQSDGRRVALVGDGVNDAPALAQADLGIALGGGTDVAVEAAAVTLSGDSLRGVLTALDLSRATFANIRQNLVGAFLYNVLGIPIAAGLLYPVFGVLLSPMIAGAAMAFSSVTVVTNANRLRRYRPPFRTAESA